MDKDYGKKMAELHLRHKGCGLHHLADGECIALRDWLKEMYRYNREMGHGINAVHFVQEYESFARICEARGLK